MENSNSSSLEKNKSDKLTPHELLQKHSNDPNHVVTNEELKNMKVGAAAEDESEVIKEANEKNDEIENLPQNDSLPNPYEVLGG